MAQGDESERFQGIAKFGVSEFTTWPRTFEEDVDLYASLGVDVMEVCEAKLGFDGAREQVELAKSKGLEIGSVQPRIHSLFPDLHRPTPTGLEDRVTALRESIAFVGAVVPEATVISISGGAIEGNYRDGLEVAVREYRKLADWAGESGVRLAFEPLNPILMNRDTLICTLSDALRLVHAVDRPNFGIWLDVWHVWQDPAVAEAIGRCGDRIFGVHVSDWHTPRCFEDRAMIGSGDIPLSALLRSIVAAGYTGALTLELFSPEWLPDSLWSRDPRDVISEARRGLEVAWLAAVGD